MKYSTPSLIFIKENDTTLCYLVEKFIEGEFTKFTSNEFLLEGAQYSEEEKALVEFSHWTHMWTDQCLMVVDLQGFRNGNRFFLTDPAIHSKESQFGKTDLGPNGFWRYFLFHNSDCRLQGYTYKLKKMVLNKAPYLISFFKMFL